MAETGQSSGGQAKPKQEEFWGDTQRRMSKEYASLESKLAGINPSTQEGVGSLSKFIDDAYNISIYHGLKARGKVHELRRKHVDGMLGAIPTPDGYTVEKLSDELIANLKAADNSLSLLPFYHPDRWARKKELQKHISKHVNGLYTQADSLYLKLKELKPADTDADLNGHKQEIGGHVTTLKGIVERLGKYSTLHSALSGQKRLITYNIDKIKHSSVETLLQMAKGNVEEKLYDRAHLYLEHARELVNTFWPAFYHMPKKEYLQKIDGLQKLIDAAGPQTTAAPSPAPTPAPAQQGP